MLRNQDLVARIDAELEELIPRFFENTRREIHALREALKTGDMFEVQRLGHSVKGAGLGYGFNGMGEIGKAIEAAAHENRPVEEIDSLIDDLDYYEQNVRIEYVSS